MKENNMELIEVIANLIKSIEIANSHLGTDKSHKAIIVSNFIDTFSNEFKILQKDFRIEGEDSFNTEEQILRKMGISNL
jgi:hypothetical protein